MRSTALRSNAAKIFASVTLLAGAAGVAGMGTFGAFTDTTSADVEVSTTKKVDLRLNGQDAVTLPTQDLAPGDSRVFGITLDRPADSLKVGALFAEGTATPRNALADALRIEIRRCARAWVPTATSMTCPGGDANGTPVHTGVGLGRAPLQSGAFADWLTRLNQGDKIHLRATVTLPAGTASDAAHGLSTALHYEISGTPATGTSEYVAQP